MEAAVTDFRQLVSPSDDPEQLSAAVTRGQLQYYQTDIVPYENEALAFVMDNGAPNDAANLASARVDRFFDSDISRGMSDRLLSRSGVVPTQEQRDVGERRRDLTHATARTSAANTARRATRDTQVDTAVDLGRTGRDLTTGATRATGSAADMATRRQEAGRNAEQAQTQSMLSSVATGAGIGFAAGFGPIGAAVGGGLGLALSLLG